MNNEESKSPGLNQTEPLQRFTKKIQKGVITRLNQTEEAKISSSICGICRQ